MAFLGLAGAAGGTTAAATTAAEGASILGAAEAAGVGSALGEAGAAAATTEGMQALQSLGSTPMAGMERTAIPAVTPQGPGGFGGAVQDIGGMMSADNAGDLMSSFGKLFGKEGEGNSLFNSALKKVKLEDRNQEELQQRMQGADNFLQQLLQFR